MVAVMLFAGGAVLAFRPGIDALREEHHIETLVPSLLSVSIAIESVSFGIAVREFNRIRQSRDLWRSIRDSKDASLIVVLLEDTAALLGLVVALAGTALVAATGAGQWDGIASLVIGVLLAVTAVVLAVETKALLIGEAASREGRASIRTALLAMDEVETVEGLQTMQLGPTDSLVDVEVDFRDGLTGFQLEQAIVGPRPG